LACALADVPDCLAGTLADASHGLASAFPDVAHRLAGALPDILKGALGALSDLLGRVTRLVDRLTRTLADLGDRPAQPLDELRVAIKARHQTVDDGGDVIQPGLEQRLDLDALYVERHLAQVDIDSNVQLDEVQHIGLDRQVRVEVIELEVDQVYPQLWNVEQNVGRPTGIALLAAFVPAELPIGLVAAPASPLRRSRSVSAPPAA
jgi:hypothetical protein